MSTKSKTGAKLVASVRKSKTGTVASKTSQRPDANESKAKPKATAATRSASKTTTSKSASTTPTNQGRKDVYSFGRRVWPD